MIKAIAIVCLLPFTWQDTVPYKVSEEYEVIVDYKFKDRPAEDQYKADFDSETNNKGARGPLPYLKLQIKLLKLSNQETKVRVVDSNGRLIYNRKATLDAIIKLDLGFIDDVKDRVSPYEFKLLLTSDAKASISQIHMIVLEDGTFLVNNEKKGKF
jgi:hypothetical protein